MLVGRVDRFNHSSGIVRLGNSATSPYVSISAPGVFLPEREFRNTRLSQSAAVLLPLLPRLGCSRSVREAEAPKGQQMKGAKVAVMSVRLHSARDRTLSYDGRYPYPKAFLVPSHFPSLLAILLSAPPLPSPVPSNCQSHSTTITSRSPLLFGDSARL